MLPNDNSMKEHAKLNIQTEKLESVKVSNEQMIRRMIQRVYQYPQTRPYAQNLIDNKRKQAIILGKRLKEMYAELDIMRDELNRLEIETEFDKARVYIGEIK